MADPDHLVCGIDEVEAFEQFGDALASRVVGEMVQVGHELQVLALDSLFEGNP